MPDYPKRSSFFANQFCRLMVKVCLCQELGTGAFALLATIAHTEDAAHYRRPVTWFNEQLMAVLGMSRDQLVRVRKKCVDAGWLVYAPGAKGRAGKYFVVIPEHSRGLDDQPTDEGDDDNAVWETDGIAAGSGNLPSGIQTASKAADPIPSGIRTESALDPRRNTRRIPDGKPAPFIPVPDPYPKGAAQRDASHAIEAQEAGDDHRQSPQVATTHRRAGRRWNGTKVRQPDFEAGSERDSLERANQHFTSALVAGHVRELDALPWHTLWLHCRRNAARTDEGRILNPAAVFVASIQAGEWLGSNEDEDAAHQFLKSLRPALTAPEFEQVGAALAADPYPVEDDDGPRC